MSEPFKILYLIDSFRIGGKERRLLELLRYFESNKNYNGEVIILNNRIDYSQVYELKRTKIIVIERKFKKDFFVFIKIWKICRKSNPDILHSWGSMPSVYGVLVAKIIRAPLINAMIVKGNCDFLSKEWIRSRITFPFSTLIVSNSFAGLRAYKAPPLKSHVIYNGFNLDRVRNLENPETVIKQLGIRTKYVVGMIAAFYPRKDYVTFLNAATIICNKRTDITFLAIGDGPAKSSLEKDYNHPSIVFTGNIKKVEQVINVLDIGILLSNPQKHQEGISNAILEIMALGKPVIASEGGGTNEIVEHKKSGILIPPQSVIDLTESIYFLIDNKKIRLKYGKEAKRLIRESFSIEKMGNDNFVLYQKLRYVNQKTPGL